MTSGRGVASLLTSARNYYQIEKDGRAHVTDGDGLRRDGIELLVREAVFAPDPTVRAEARYLIWQASQELGALSSSIQGLYAARGRGQAKGFTVPALNIRGMTFDVARTALRAARANDVGALIFELAKSEVGYTHQAPEEYCTVILAAAVKENWRRPIFVQGDHYQFNAKRYEEDSEAETEGIRKIVRDSLAAGYLNIDVDASTLVDLEEPTVPKQQALNARLTAEMTDLIRGLEPAEIPVSVGGEIGEVGKANSTEEELRAFLDQYKRSLARRRKEALGLSKISIQTGTHHGGVVGPDGKVLEVDVDFETIRRLSAVALEEYQMAGCVQHGASTLPDEMFHQFPQAGAAEIHLATGIQNAIYDHADFPAAFRKKIYVHLEKAHADERKSNETIEQFHYKTRKKAFGPLKREFWDLEEGAKSSILKTVEQRFSFWFRELKVTHTAGVVKQHVEPMRVPHQPPAVA